MRARAAMHAPRREFYAMCTVLVRTANDRSCVRDLVRLSLDSSWEHRTFARTEACGHHNDCRGAWPAFTEGSTSTSARGSEAERLTVRAAVHV